VKYKILIIFFLLITLNTYSYGQTIAYANLDKVIKSSEVGKKIINYFYEKNEKMISKIKLNENEIREKEKSLISQKNVLQADEYNKKVNLIKSEIKDFNINRKKQIDVLNIEKDKVSKSFLIEINKILRDYAEENNIDIILSSNQMLVGKSNLDVTENIITKVNKKITKFEIKVNE
tara:strand:- start:400 stop:927 length:528 start_codon:yes stop_codon:yes gene_type:complete